MTISTRLATLDDAKGITEVHCSSITDWIKIVNGKKIKASYDELTIEERWSHGGPWMSVETCAIRLNYLLIHGQYPLVAEINGKIVGELEMYIGDEADFLGKNAYIDVIEVHKMFRRRGIGKALIEKAIAIAKENYCDTIAVWPTREAIGFYKKCGIGDIAYDITILEIDLDQFREENVPSLDPFPCRYEVVKDLILVTPRIFPSFPAWLKQWMIFDTEKRRLISIKASIDEGTAVFSIGSLWSDKECGNLYLWVKNLQDLPEILRTVASIAKKADFKRLRLYVDKTILDEYFSQYSFRVIGDEVLLFRKLKTS
ncbi:MAG: GNAT family N-acetyltransferase [Candidatus Njordarchaeales archaeon]